MNTNQTINFLSFYMQLTPWVQAVVVLSVCASMLGAMWLLKEVLVALKVPARATVPSDRIAREYSREGEGHEG